jgi:hypothetical protein
MTNQDLIERLQLLEEFEPTKAKTDSSLDKSRMETAFPVDYMRTLRRGDVVALTCPDKPNDLDKADLA